MARLQDRLTRLTQQNFVGRDTEINLFREAIIAPSLAFCLLYIYGPGGVGKTTLTRRLMQVCERESIPYFLLDARRIEASPEAFLHAYTTTVTGEDRVKRVIFIDTYEQIAPLDTWFREVFLPELPEETFVVFAGRTLPAIEWRTHLGWRELCNIIPLENLSQEECRQYLSARNVPEAQHKSALQFTHGHPLALALAADVLAQRSDLDLSESPPPDILHALLERFANEVPTEQHRETLEAAALTRVVTEEYLDHTLGSTLNSKESAKLFRWLQTLSFLERGEEGLLVHDSVREVLMSELRWRNREHYLHLHQRARDYYFERYHQHIEYQTTETLFDYIYLHRHIAAVRPFFDWYAHNDLIADTYRPTDRRSLLEMVLRHEGEASCRIAAHWIKQQPQNIIVFREPGSDPTAIAGWMIALDLSSVTPEDCRADNVTSDVVRFLAHSAPLREGERGTFFRFWMAAEAYQEVSPVQNQVFIHAVKHYLTANLAYSIFPFARPDFWSIVMHYGDIPRVDALDFNVNGRIYGCFAHDWRETPPAAWLALVTERQQWLDAKLEEDNSQEISVVTPLPASLSKEEFSEALRLALKSFTQPDRLLHNPLLRARMTLETAGLTADAEKRVRALKELILATSAPLQNSPRDARLYTALELSYFRPAPSQEKAAEIQDVSYATFRRYLSAAQERLLEALWARENGEWRKMSSN